MRKIILETYPNAADERLMAAGQELAELMKFDTSDGRKIYENNTLSVLVAEVAILDYMRSQPDRKWTVRELHNEIKDTWRESEFVGSQRILGGYTLDEARRYSLSHATFSLLGSRALLADSSTGLILNPEKPEFDPRDYFHHKKFEDAEKAGVA